MSFSSSYSSCWDFVPNNARHIFHGYKQCLISGQQIREILSQCSPEKDAPLLMLTYPGERVFRGLLNALKQEKCIIEIHIPEKQNKDELLEIKNEILKIAQTENFDLPWSLSTALHIDSLNSEKDNHHFQNKIFSLFEAGFTELHLSYKNMYAVELLNDMQQLKQLTSCFWENELGLTFKLYKCELEDLLNGCKILPQARWCLSTPAIDLVHQFAKHQLDAPHLCYPSLLSARNRDFFPNQSCCIDGYLLRLLSPLVLGEKSRSGQELLYHFDNERSIKRLKSLLPHYAQKDLIEAKSYISLTQYIKKLNAHQTARRLCEKLKEKNCAVIS